MGVIKDGSISGVLPSNKVFTVNYPGYPSSIERALVTLGGTQGIAKARESQSKAQQSRSNIELHFRPEDPYSHPVNGEVMPCNHFLLKLSKHNIKENERQILEGPEDQICADIVGHVSESYYFNGMADYQHVLAVHADVARKKKRTRADMEPQFEKNELIDADQVDLMILLPPLFSLTNTQDNVVMKQSMNANQKNKQMEVVQQRLEMEIEPCLAIDFNIKDVPKKVNWEKFIPKGTEEWQCQMAVCDLFDERPVWIREHLSQHLSNKGLELTTYVIKRFLFRAAYYFSKGPFLKFFIRKGYDPRKDPESRIYQKIDFIVPESLRSYCNGGIESGSKHTWEDLCGFRVFPYKCQTTLQLFDLVDDYIQQEIRKPLTQTSCTLATGWFPPHVLEILRSRVAVRFLSVYPHPGAEFYIERSKRKINAIKEKIAANKDEVHTEEKEMSDDKDDEDDEDDEIEDIEDENVDGDFDAYEGVDMGGIQDDTLPESSYIDQEDVSKVYLPKLFGSFQNNGGGLQDDGAENSDEEYHIFDGSNSHDDDDDDY